MKRWLALIPLLVACTPWVDAPGKMSPRSLVEGNQATIDSGRAVNWTGCWPAQGCTVFLAGHRTTHGSIFAPVANLQPGDIVRVGYGGKVYVYEVTVHRIVSGTLQLSAVLRGDLMLQTTASGGMVHLIYAECAMLGPCR